MFRNLRLQKKLADDIRYIISRVFFKTRLQKIHNPTPANFKMFFADVLKALKGHVFLPVASLFQRVGKKDVCKNLFRESELLSSGW